MWRVALATGVFLRDLHSSEVGIPEFATGKRLQGESYEAELESMSDFNIKYRG